MSEHKNPTLPSCSRRKNSGHRKYSTLSEATYHFNLDIYVPEGHATQEAMALEKLSQSVESVANSAATFLQDEAIPPADIDAVIISPDLFEESGNLSISFILKQPPSLKQRNRTKAESAFELQIRKICTADCVVHFFTTRDAVFARLDVGKFNLISLRL